MALMKELGLKLQQTNTVGTPTELAFSVNNDPYIALTSGTAVEIGIDSGDTLRFKVDGLRDDAASFNIVNKSDSDTLLDTVTGTVSNKHFFILSSGTTDGSMGGLSGADSFCLSDLQGSSWKGKDSVNLSAATVSAFLCDTSTCQNPVPNKTHYFARSGSASSGGGSFIADSNGHGPGDRADWEDSDYFDITFSTGYWTGRTGSTNTLWDDDLPTSGQSCNDWSGTSGTGKEGSTNWDDSTRWSATGTELCNRPERVICLVHDL